MFTEWKYRLPVTNAKRNCQVSSNFMFLFHENNLSFRKFSVRIDWQLRLAPTVSAYGSGNLEHRQVILDEVLRQKLLFLRI